MRIEDYFQQVRQTIDACTVAQASNVTFDKRSTYEGFIRGEVYFVDGSVLHLRENEPDLSAVLEEIQPLVKFE